MKDDPHNWVDNVCSQCKMSFKDVVLNVNFKGYLPTCPLTLPPTPPKTAFQVYREKLSQRFKHTGYVSLGKKKTTLDGQYSALQLRQIANAMDQLAEFKE